MTSPPAALPDSPHLPTWSASSVTLVRRRPVVCLLGPTASGKTAAALALADREPVEIISVDSALVYRAMDIGTAKPSLAERARVPHHLIDIIEPTAAWSAAQFRVATLALIDEIEARGRRPLLVGGTMLYYKALVDGLHNLPAADPAVRARLDARAASAGWPALHARLMSIDPTSAARIEPNDAQRIGRALEVWEISGQTLSALLAAPRPGPASPAAPSSDRPGASDAPPEDGAAEHAGPHVMPPRSGPPSSAPPPLLSQALPSPHLAPPDFVAISLEPTERSILHERIARRFDAMLDNGFIAEVSALRARGDLHAGLPSMRCVGYRQAWAYLDGAIDYAMLRNKGIFATRQLCKRQLTWLRSLPARTVIDCCAPDATARAVAAALSIWDNR